MDANSVAPTVHMGTCGWTYDFYPKSCTSVTQKLDFICSKFPAVEVNTSTYAIPSPATTASWAKATCQGFKFHFKAFGLFCSRGCSVANLPGPVKAMLPPHLATKSYINQSEMTPEAVQTTWDLFHASLEPVYQANKLGIIVFQFHLTFEPSQTNLDYITDCRKKLDSKYSMAVELRCRSWFTNSNNNSSWREQITTLLKRHGIALIQADELEHETFQKDREQRGLQPGGAIRRVLPIADVITTPEYAYARLHRRHGSTERILSADEIEFWSHRIQNVVASGELKGPFYIMWGTDYADAPLKNAAALQKALPDGVKSRWQPPARGVAKLFAQARTGSKRTSSESQAADNNAISPVDKKTKKAASAANKKGIGAYFQRR